MSTHVAERTEAPPRTDRAPLLKLIGSAGNAAIAFRRGWWFGFGHHLLGLYWITEAILIESARYWWFVPIAVPRVSTTCEPVKIVAPLARL